MGIEGGPRELDIQTAKENGSNFNESMKIALEDGKIDSKELLALKEQYEQERANTIKITMENLVKLGESLGTENPRSLGGVFNKLLSFRGLLSEEKLTNHGNESGELTGGDLDIEETVDIQATPVVEGTITQNEPSNSEVGEEISNNIEITESQDLPDVYNNLKNTLTELIGDKQIVNIDGEYFFISEELAGLGKESLKVEINGNQEGFLSVEEILGVIENTPGINLGLKDINRRILSDNLADLNDEQKLGLILSVTGPIDQINEEQYDNYLDSLKDLSNHMPELPSSSSKYEIFTKENFNETLINNINGLLDRFNIKNTREGTIVEFPSRNVELNNFLDWTFIGDYGFPEGTNFSIVDGKINSIDISYEQITPFGEINIHENGIITGYESDGLHLAGIYRLQKGGEEIMIMGSSLKEYMSQFEGVATRNIENDNRNFDINNVSYLQEQLGWSDSEIQSLGENGLELKSIDGDGIYIFDLNISRRNFEELRYNSDTGVISFRNNEFTLGDDKSASTLIEVSNSFREAASIETSIESEFMRSERVEGNTHEIRYIYKDGLSEQIARDVRLASEQILNSSNIDELNIAKENLSKSYEGEGEFATEFSNNLNIESSREASINLAESYLNSVKFDSSVLFGRDIVSDPFNLAEREWSEEFSDINNVGLDDVSVSYDDGGNAIVEFVFDNKGWRNKEYNKHVITLDGAFTQEKFNSKIPDLVSRSVNRKSAS